MSEVQFSNTRPEIETSRLRLKPIGLDDLDGLFELIRDPEVIRYFAPSKPMEREDVKVALQSMIAHWEQHGFGRMSIILKETGQMIGYSGLRTLEGIPEIIYTVAKQYWGKGLA